MIVRFKVGLRNRILSLPPETPCMVWYRREDEKIIVMDIRRAWAGEEAGDGMALVKSPSLLYGNRTSADRWREAIAKIEGGNNGENPRSSALDAAGN